MPKINQEEYEVLKGLDDTWKYLARNNMYGAKLEAHTSQPYKMTDSHWSNGDMTLELLGGEHLFQFIQWKDEFPYNIQELIEEYLYDNQPKLFIDGQEQSFEFIEESEEKEVKDLQWMKEQLEKDYADGKRVQSRIKDGEKIDGIDLNSYWRGSQTANYIARCYLEDLDEPETLSEDWIQEHSYNVHLLGTPDVTTVVVSREDLQNLLVPKQEEVDQAYKDGYEKGKQHTFYKGYLEGLADKGSEPETVADVVTTFWKSYERLKEVMNMEIEELEEC